MTKSLTLRSSDLTALNLVLCDLYSEQFELCRPHSLKMINKNLGDLNSTAPEYRVAYAAYMINKLRPFASLNARTAVLLLFINGPVGDAHSIAIYQGLIKHDTDVKVVAEALVGP